MCWRKNREVMKDIQSMGMKRASWDFVSVSRACSVGLLCSLSRYTASAYQPSLSFSLHTLKDLGGIQPKLWVAQIKPASLMQLFWKGGGDCITVRCPVRTHTHLYDIMKEKVSYETGWTRTLAYSVYINNWQWGLVWFIDTSCLHLDELETRGSIHDDADLSGHAGLSWSQLPAQICGFTITVCFPVWFPLVTDPVISL